MRTRGNQRSDPRPSDPSYITLVEAARKARREPTTVPDIDTVLRTSSTPSARARGEHRYAFDGGRDHDDVFDGVENVSTSSSSPSSAATVASDDMDLDEFPSMLEVMNALAVRTCTSQG